MPELNELQRRGMSIQAISELTGWDRKTIRKYMQAAGVVPEYGPRSGQPSKLDALKPYLEERLRAGVRNARVLLARTVRERNCAGGYTILTDWLRPQRSAVRVVAGSDRNSHGIRSPGSDMESEHGRGCGSRGCSARAGSPNIGRQLQDAETGYGRKVAIVRKKSRAADCQCRHNLERIRRLDSRCGS